MLRGQHPVRRVACLVLLLLAVVSAVGHAIYQIGTGWSGSVMLWAVIALLTWDIMDHGDQEQLLS